jgi:acid phosphatase (class A)
MAYCQISERLHIIILVLNSFMNPDSSRRSPVCRPGRRGGVLTLCLLLLVALPLFADGNYIAPDKLDGIALLAPPPAPGSAEEAADLASARAIFNGRTPAEDVRAHKDSSLSLFLFAPAVGPFFQPGKLPKTEALFKKVKEDIGEPINIPTRQWKRRRPYQMDEQLFVGIREPSYGYPSGHSTRGTVYSLVMAELFPEQKDAILAVGRTIGWDRVLLGVHFPTDIYAGRVLGQAIFRELMASPAFQHDLAEAKAEAHDVQPAPIHEAVNVGAGTASPP